MKPFLAQINDSPRLVALLGSLSGWVSVERIAAAKDVATLVAAALAALVSLCALILTAPAAIAKARAWLSNIFHRHNSNN